MALRRGDSVIFTNEAGTLIKADVVAASVDASPQGTQSLRVPGEVADRLLVPFGTGPVGPLWRPIGYSAAGQPALQ